MTAPEAAGLRQAAQAAVGLLDRLDAQARDGGGTRRQVYLTVETWNEVFVPLRRRLLAALAAPPQPARAAMDVERLARAMHDQRRAQSFAGCGWVFGSVVDGEVLCPCPADAAAILVRLREDDPFASNEWRQMEETAAGYRSALVDLGAEEHATSDQQLRATISAPGSGLCDAPLQNGWTCTRLPNHEGVHQ